MKPGSLKKLLSIFEASRNHASGEATYSLVTCSMAAQLSNKPTAINNCSETGGPPLSALLLSLETGQWWRRAVSDCEAVVA